MLKNRSIQVKMVRDGLASENLETNVADVAYIIDSTVQSVVKGVGSLMLAYVAADTLRQILVKSTPPRF